MNQQTNLLALAENHGARATGKLDGSEASEVIFPFYAWRSFVAAMVEAPSVALPASYSSGALVSDSAGFAKVTLHFSDSDEAASWFDDLTFDVNSETRYASTTAAQTESAKPVVLPANVRDALQMAEGALVEVSPCGEDDCKQFQSEAIECALRMVRSARSSNTSL